MARKAPANRASNGTTVHAKVFCEAASAGDAGMLVRNEYAERLTHKKCPRSSCVAGTGPRPMFITG